MHNIQSPASNINREAISNASAGIRAVSEALLTDRQLSTGEIVEYLPLEPVTIGNLHYALESLAAYIHLLSGAD
ncbi:MAG: hypothetical protein QM504_10420 [Pseudomonadota bacterium]